MIKNSLRKVISLVLVLLMTFSSMVFAQGADYTGHWAEESIKGWIEKGYVKGYADGTFKPENDITRAEFIAIVNRSFGFTVEAAVTYKDVNKSHWAYDEFRRASAAGYIGGFEDGTLRPNNKITRQETAAIISRLLNLKEDKQNKVFLALDDVEKIPQWSAGVVSAMVANGYMNLRNGNSFAPAAPATRAEVISALDSSYLSVGEVEPGEGVPVDNNVPSDALLNAIAAVEAYRNASINTLAEIEAAEKLAAAAKAAIALVEEVDLREPLLDQIDAQRDLIDSTKKAIEGAKKQLATAINLAEEAIKELPAIEKITTSDADKEKIANAKALVTAVKELDADARVVGEEKIAELEAKMTDLEAAAKKAAEKAAEEAEAAEIAAAIAAAEAEAKAAAADAAEILKMATNAVARAERTNMQKDISAAQRFVEGVQDPVAKIKLETRLEVLQERINKTKADKAAAKLVEDKINTLASVITLGDKGAVAATRLAFNNLRNDQKPYVPNEGVLIAAEKRITVLEKEKADREAVAAAKKALVFPDQTGTIIYKPADKNGVSYTLQINPSKPRWMPEAGGFWGTDGNATLNRSNGNIYITRKKHGTANMQIDFGFFSFYIIVTMQKGTATDIQEFKVSVPNIGAKRPEIAITKPDADGSFPFF